MFLEEYNCNRDIEFFSNNSYFVDCDEEYYNEIYMCGFIFRNNKTNMINLFLKKMRKVE